MAIDVAEYSTSDFNSLFDYGHVLPIFDSLGGDDLAKGIMKDLFRRHKVENTLGLALLHKHSLLQDGERLIDVRGTSNPLSFEIGQPSVWGLSPDHHQLVPLEFSVEHKDIDWQVPPMQQFLVEFSNMLVTLKADKVLGLCRYPGDGYPGRVEFTVGRSNINLTPDEAELLPSAGTREAAWFYTDDFIRRGCRCNCFKNEEHNHSHGYTVGS
ncbi:hypothetical protein F5Y03DRAFT_316029 [Xylaria venustula]|nr:hypothetical protein F5Y03DRAFT_316029 [Xylaria venustula]